MMYRLRSCSQLNLLPRLGALLLLIQACSDSDLGAPCDHTNIEAPQALTLTFPAKSCNELLCLFGESPEPDSDHCRTDDDCQGSGTEQKFTCRLDPNDPEALGRCEVDLAYVLERSMCTQTCQSDDECESQAVTDTTCRTGFTCRKVQSLGDLCCRSVCVCRDNLSDNERVERECRSDNNVCDNN